EHLLFNAIDEVDNGVVLNCVLWIHNWYATDVRKFISRLGRVSRLLGRVGRLHRFCSLCRSVLPRTTTLLSRLGAYDGEEWQSFLRFSCGCSLVAGIGAI